MELVKKIKKGMKVEILSRKNKLSQGIVDDVAPREHPYKGIIVRLVSGEIGRVQRVLEETEPEIDFDFYKLLKSPENYYCEFKENVLWSQNFTEEDVKKSKSFEVHMYKKRASKIIIAKTIASFLNSDGGNLIIGVREKKDKGSVELIGVEEEFKKLKDKHKDGYKRMIIDEIIKPFFPSKISDHLNKYIFIDFVRIDNKILCWIRINKSDTRVFLTLDDKEVFMIRVDCENKMLEGEKLVDYCIRRF